MRFYGARYLSQCYFCFPAWYQCMSIAVGGLKWPGSTQSPWRATCLQNLWCAQKTTTTTTIKQKPGKRFQYSVSQFPWQHSKQDGLRSWGVLEARKSPDDSTCILKYYLTLIFLWEIVTQSVNSFLTEIFSKTSEFPVCTFFLISQTWFDLLILYGDIQGWTLPTPIFTISAEGHIYDLTPSCWALLGARGSCILVLQLVPVLPHQPLPSKTEEKLTRLNTASRESCLVSALWSKQFVSTQRLQQQTHRSVFPTADEDPLEGPETQLMEYHQHFKDAIKSNSTG